MKIRKLAMTLMAGLGIFSLAACGSGGSDSGADANGKTVGIAMPSKALERWEKDGDYMVSQLKEKGYETDIQYAQDSVPTQVSQIENMITKGVDVIVIASIDGEALTDVVSKAQKEEIPVIAYDRLIMNAEGVDYYATFDNFEVGVIQGQYIVDKLDLANQAGPFNIELFGGAPDDNNARFFYDGAMSILEPFIDEGKLVVKSGQTDFNKIAIKNWDGATAQARMDNLLSASYTDEKVDAVLAPNDAVAMGVVSSLKGVGYGSGDRPMPVITGQDAEAASVKSIIAGDQTMTVFKNTQELAGVAATMVDQILNDKKVEVNDTETYDNNEKVVPTYLLEPVSVDSDNYQEILIDSGYLKESEVK
ncbi:multiple monosaccharide ABC transporter substrate-binding protein [Enterococcus sp. 2201sp1_2201st1_B8_2201SCRN_220225]|uniref:multiple monosaccharide ABC transporter substrate-binding protein n=1 Tax=unclassified Enterococcus TaxID=2608891 RepID=UPI0034A165EA